MKQFDVTAKYPKLFCGNRDLRRVCGDDPGGAKGLYLVLSSADKPQESQLAAAVNPSRAGRHCRKVCASRRQA